MVEAHTTRAHSKIGPSAAHRWIACPGSVGLSRGEPNRSSSFALEGTAAHELCEQIMRHGEEPDIYLGGVVSLPNEIEPERTNRPVGIFKESDSNPEPDGMYVWTIDEEMVEAVEIYRDTLAPYITPGSTVELECRLDLTHIHRDFFGTGDALVYQPAARHLIVGDFKYGRGIAVDVDDNEQLLSYAVGALRRYQGQVDKLTLIVIQPRAFHRHGPVRKQETDIVDLLFFEEFLRQRAALTDDPNAPLLAGDHCRFCPIAHACPELRGLVFKIIKATDTMRLPDIHKLSQDELGEIAQNVTMIESFIKRVMEHAHREALDGRVPTGMKLVAKRAYRKWKDRGNVECTLDLLGYTEDQYHAEPKMMSVAMVEKLMGKKTFAKDMQGLWVQESNGVVLALEDDAREVVKLDKTDAFGVVDDE